MSCSEVDSPTCVQRLASKSCANQQPRTNSSMDSILKFMTFLENMKGGRKSRYHQGLEGCFVVYHCWLGFGVGILSQVLKYLPRNSHQARAFPLLIDQHTQPAVPAVAPWVGQRLHRKMMVLTVLHGLRISKRYFSLVQPKDNQCHLPSHAPTYYTLASGGIIEQSPCGRGIA